MKKEKFDKIFLVSTLAILALIIGLAVWIRTQNIPQLKDVTTGNYTLGPDLDPYLFLRNAKEIVKHKLEDPDKMRLAPLGVKNYAKTSLMPWAIVAIYKIFRIESIEFAAIIAPVIFFSLTLIVFFIFARKLFSTFMDKRKSTIAALIATAFYAVIPAMQHRTTAGIPELESLGMLWFWPAFYFFLSAWQENKIKKLVLFSILSGIFTGLTIWSWGVYRYIFMTFALASFLAFFFNKEKRKNLIIYTCWLIPSLISIILKSRSFLALTSISDTGFASAVFFLLLIDFAVFNTKLKKIKEKLRIPESVISLIFVIFIFLLVLLFFKPSFIQTIISTVVERFIYPFGRTRIGLTVAENKAPYFSDVIGSFGEAFFWLFFFGTLLLFYESTKHFERKNKIILNFFFLLFLLTFIFSRISPNSLLNGENFISKFLYFFGLALFAFVLLYLYISGYRKKEKVTEHFKEIGFSSLLILSFIFWMVVSMRGAIRLFFIISPALILASSFLPVKLFDYTMKTKDSVYKTVLSCLLILVAVFLSITFINYEKVTAFNAKYTIPTGYYQQWQKAMKWVRENTPKDAIFVHWWDYGYWIQTLGERATVTDGGHPNGFWDHMVARYVLTAQNKKTALQFCKAHNVSYLLIDSTDIGKYPAYGSIGSDKNGKDRLSWISTFVLDEKQTREFRNETKYVYVGGTMLDDDIVWKDQLFPEGKAGIAGFVMSIGKNNEVKGVEAVIVYNKKQFNVPIKYVYIDGRLVDISNGKEAIEACLYLIPKFDGNSISNIGASLYLSKKALSALWVKLYLLNQNDEFELVHKQDDPIVEQLKAYNLTNSDLVYVKGYGLKGPIKIWKLHYPKDIKFYKEYLELIPLEGNFAKLDYLGV